jgi:hypothetical protein
MIAELTLAASLVLGGGLDAVRSLAEHRPVPHGPTVLERAALECRARTGLEELRAGDPALPGAGADTDERAALDQAQQDAGDLEQQRGGEIDLTEREITIIAITAAAILLLVLIL